jgi:hypothetical protein
MTEISARSILASVSPEGIRIDTIVARYPLWIHAELMTHRAFSRNAASNRAIPFARMAATVRADPAVPLFWTSEQKGMQGQEIEDPAIRERANTIWNRALREALDAAEALSELGIHKQAANRLLMPFQHITVQITSTDWANFDALRDHPDAEPHMRELAATIKDARRAATLQPVGFGDWHLPWVTPEERERLRLWPQQTLSVARSASISYDTVDGQWMTLERAQSLVAKLMAAPPNPVHASPFEHQAMPDRWDPYRKTWESKDVHGNLFGWMQYRKMLTREAVSDPGRERFR